MSLVLPNDWVWDFWLADTGTEYHLFFLKAQRSLGDPDSRHANATIGHAVSTDLHQWDLVSDAITPGKPGTWDDRAIWTGSVIEHDGTWYMLYTGTSVAERGAIQRIGVATSDDLVHWDKFDEPVVEADGRWYELIGDSSWPEQAWRDPWVMRVGDRYHILITARSNHGPADGRGVIGHAVSDDLRVWEVEPPLSEPGDFGHLEVPQVVHTQKGWLHVFSCEEQRVSTSGLVCHPQQAGDLTYVVSADEQLGPFDVSKATPSLPRGLYSGRLVKSRDGSWMWLAFVGDDEAGQFVGEISDPIPLTASDPSEM